MRTPKIEALYRLIDWLNKNRNSNITKLPLDNSPLSDNAWLSGFIEADGNFYSSFNVKGIAEGLRHYMKISQKSIYNDKNSNILTENNTNLNIMETIREFLKVKNVYEIKRTKEKYLELGWPGPII